MQADAFVVRQGGAPANVAVQLARLGVHTSLISAVGRDPLGERLLNALREEGVDTTAVGIRDKRRTGITFVEVEPSGERRFFGYRDNSADLSLSLDDLATKPVQQALAQALIVHTGTVSLRTPATRRATSCLVRTAQKNKQIVSLDVNLRPGMFSSMATMLKLARQSVKRAAVLKATREEAELLLDLAPPARHAGAKIRQAHDERLVDELLQWGPRLVLLTLGHEGAVVGNRLHRARFEAPAENVVDATGAGDGFMGAVLAELMELDVHDDPTGSFPLRALSALGEDDLAGLATVGCRAGAAVVGAVGATTGMLRGHPLGVLRGLTKRSRLKRIAR